MGWIPTTTAFAPLRRADDWLLMQRGEAVAVVAEQSGAPLLSGTVPPLAESYHPRRETGFDVSGLRPGQTVVLTHGEQTAATPAAQGGTGKTQLAVEFARTVWDTRAVEVLVWVTAATREGILTGFADAADSVGASDPDEAAEVAATRFTAWLAHTRRPWALIIDDLADAADLRGLWPAGPAGQVVITTRLPGDSLRLAADHDLSVVPVGRFIGREALAYVSSRLIDYPDQRVEVLDLCEDLDGLPLALAQATDVINARRLSCREYRAQFAERRKDISSVPAPGLSAEVLATWSLAVECAQRLPPEGLAWAALTLAALLGPHGIPSAVLTTPSACGFITGRPDATGQGLVRAVLTSLARLGLVSIDLDSPVQLVRMHHSTQVAVRVYLPRAQLGQVVRTAADALTEAWQAAAGGPQFDQAMRDCTTALRATDAGSLWQPQAHPLLLRAGSSLRDSGLTDSAVAYWQSMVATSTRLLGPVHAGSLAVRDKLAAAFETAGRAGDAMAVSRSVLGDRERNQGPDHPETIAARGHLAHACQLAGRHTEAVALYESAVGSFDRQLGRGHPDTWAARASLVAAYQQAGKVKESLAACEMLLTDAERLLGADHPTTLAARLSLAEAYQSAGQPRDAIEQYKRVLAAQQGLHGPVHPETIAARASLASALRRAGKLKDATAQYEQVLADRERVEGADHPDTIAARANLAFAYRSAGRLREAIPAYERTLADRERLAGPDHRDTRTARANLAAAYQQADRITDAIPHFERVVADSERMVGAGSLETLTARCGLASALYADGRLMEGVTMLERALADCERHLGSGHQMTRTVRDNLSAATAT
jgi:tetratricopeptide (TPR) repeat protein